MKEMYYNSIEKSCIGNQTELLVVGKGITNTWQKKYSAYTNHRHQVHGTRDEIRFPMLIFVSVANLILAVYESINQKVMFQLVNLLLLLITNYLIN